jgi:spoIIIJ-associated protein
MPCRQEEAVTDGAEDTTVVDSGTDSEPTTPGTAEVAADVTGEDTAASVTDPATDGESTDAESTVAESTDADPTGAGPIGADPDDASDEDSDEDESDEDEDSDNPLDVEGEVAADYLEELLDIADLDGDIDTYVENGRAHVSILTDSEVLVGPDGEVLDALQELSRLAVITETGNRSRLMLDIGGYRERRRKALTDLATDAVAEVKDSGESVRLAPMNPFERKIVHDVVAEAGLTSESEGEEPQRRVVILPSA